MKKRGTAVESALARVCREGGARVRTHQFIRDLNISGISPTDTRKIEIICDGLPLYHGRQLAIDATMVSSLNGNGNPHPRAATEDGAVFRTARQRKERTYPEFLGRGARAGLVVFAIDTGGRWSQEASRFLSALAYSRSRDAPAALQKSSYFAWKLRWKSIIAVAAHRAFAASLSLSPETVSAEGNLAGLEEVLEDARFLP